MTSPTISSVAISNPSFSPQGYPAFRTTQLSGVANEPGSWTIDITSGGSTIKSFGGATLLVMPFSFSQVWDGTNSSGQPAGEGNYAARFGGHDRAGNPTSNPDFVLEQVAIDLTGPTIVDPAISPPSFSPNNDGFKDEVVVSASLDDPSGSGITWQIDVRSGSGVRVRSLFGAGSPLSESWNGRNDASVMSPDGSYSAVITGRDILGNASQSASLSTLLDTQPPSITGATATTNPFSPNVPPDGIKDTTRLRATVSDPSGIEGWTLDLKNATGQVVRQYTGTTGVDEPWNGKDQAGAAVPDGVYSSVLSAIDHQHLVRTTIWTVVVDTVAPAAQWNASPTVFNPARTSSAIQGSLTESVTWQAFIKNSTGTTVRVLAGTGSQFATSWDGRASGGQELPDGSYPAALVLTDAAGNAGSGTGITFRLDTVAPTVAVQVSGATVSPNGDSIADTAGISGTFGEVANWSLTINGAGTEVYASSGDGSSVALTWTGFDASGDPLPDALYDLSITATDAAGNQGTGRHDLIIDLTPPVALGYEAFPNPFRPESLPPRHQTVISTGFSEQATYTATIKNIGGTVVRTLQGSGDSMSVPWDGRDESREPVPDGQYQVSLTSVDSVANLAQELLWLIVGDGPVVASIEPATPEVGGLVTIRGSGFGTRAGVYGISVAGEAGFVSSWSDTTIVAGLPPGIPAGPAFLRVWTSDVTSLAFPITLANYSRLNGNGEGFASEYIAFRVAPGTNPTLITTANGDPSPTRVFPSDSDALLARWYEVRVPAGAENTRILAYAANPSIEWAEGIPLPKPDAIPNDPSYSDQWGLDSPSGADINAPQAWDRSKGSSSHVIAIIDSGVGPHPDLDSKLLPGKQYVGAGETPDEGCRRSSSHGTHVAGIAAAKTDNSLGIAGVAWNSKLRAYKVFRDEAVNGSWKCLPPKGVRISNIMRQAAIDGNHVINMSLGCTLGEDEGCAYSQAWQDAIDVSWKEGVIIVAAAGNDQSGKAAYPAAYNNVLGVGALDEDGTRASFSNFGEYADVFAPGTNILSTRVNADGSSGYVRAQGTSVAAPFASGTAALMRARANSNVAIVSAITRSRAGSLRWLDANGALSVLKDPPAPGASPVVHPNGTFVRSTRADSPAIYWLQFGYRLPVPSHRVLNSWGIAPSSSQIIRIQPAELRQYQMGGALGFRPGSLLGPADSLTQPGVSVLVVTNEGTGSSANRWTRGNRRGVTPSSFACLGYSSARVIAADADEVGLHQEGQLIADCTHPGGSVIKATTGTYWILESGMKRRVRAISILNSYSMAQSAVSTILTDIELSGRSEADWVGWRPGSLIRDPDAALYVVSTDGTDFLRGQKRQLPTSEIGCFRYSTANAISTYDANFSDTLHATASPLAC